MKSKIISTLIENPDWYQSLVSQGVPLDPDQGEQIHQCAERITDVLLHKGFFAWGIYSLYLEEQLKRAIDLLETLRDLQNGPPLEKYRTEWEETTMSIDLFLHVYKLESEEE